MLYTSQRSYDGTSQFHLLFVSSLCERKNEEQKEAKVPLRMTTSGHGVSPV
jgi:hypothetical protein